MSRKLSTVICGVVGVLGIILGSALIGDVVTEIQVTGIASVAGICGFNVFRQAAIDKAQVTQVIETENLASKVLAQAKSLEERLSDA